MSTAEAALNYAAAGWAVFPCWGVTPGACSCRLPSCSSPGKHPVAHLAPRGVINATSDSATITRWWRANPQWNVAIATGQASGLVVLDVDSYHGGDESLVELERRHGGIGETVQALTGGGGKHLFFRHPGSPVPNRVALAPGLDLRADGGYIIAPPSTHASGRRYAWDLAAHPDNVGLAPAPAWVLAKAQEPATTRLRRDGTALVIDAGMRNTMLLRLGGAIRRYGVGREALLACLVAINRHHCQPPLSDTEVRRIAESVSRYAPATTKEGGSSGRVRAAGGA